MAESEEELKSFLMKVKEEGEKAGLKLSIQETKIMAYSPSLSWQKEVERVEAVTGFIFLGSKITADGHWGHEIERRLLLGRKAILKSRDITLLTNVCIAKAMVFLVDIYRCELDHKEGWTLKKWCFQIVVLEKSLESPFRLQGDQTSQS